MEEKIILFIKAEIKKLYNLEIEDISLNEVPKNKFGDLSFNCGILARDLRKNPNIIAEELTKTLGNNELIEEVQSIGSFINFKIKKSVYLDIFLNILDNKKDFLEPNIGNNKIVIVDYIGMNVGKPMHIGHICTPNIGQAMINLYKKTGYRVISDSHIGDWGIIFGKLIFAFKKWGDENKLKENAVDYLLELYVKVTSETLKNPELEDDIRNEFKKLSKGDSESVRIWENFTKQSILAMNKQLLRMNIKPDFNIGESFYEGLNLPKMEDYPDLKYSMSDIVEELIEKGIATKNDDNSVGVVFDESTKIPSCILQKRDGTHGYLASDLSAIKYRVENWSASNIVYFVDVRQQLHFKQAFEIASNAGWIDSEKIFHAHNGFISGKAGPFSTRKGNIIKLDKLLDEAEDRAKKIILEKRDDIEKNELEELSKIVGIGAVKYGYLKKSRETDVIFDWDEFMTFDGNSGPYIQYAYVRARKILEKTHPLTPSLVRRGGNPECFESEQEIELLKQIIDYPNVLKKTLATNMPHHLCSYTYDLTKKFSSFYDKVHILNEADENKKNLRLALTDMFSNILKESFAILGIDMPEKM